MRNILTRKFSAVTPSRGLLRNQRGQGILEYVLVLMIVLGVIFVMARPVIARLQSKFEKGIKGGIFKEDPTGGSFYYFPLK
ncbi:MAG: TadE/TadG family type IV pilus assembly protein [Bdellovibrionota bacterium]